jgi:hypothetical protein
VTELSVGHSIHVRELMAIDNVKILNSPEQVICIVTRKREEKVETEEEVEEGAEEEGAEEATD